MSSVSDVASTVASRIASQWRESNNNPCITPTVKSVDAPSGQFVVRLDHVQNTGCTDISYKGVEIIRQVARTSDTPGYTGFVWESTCVYKKPMGVVISEWIANFLVSVTYALACIAVLCTFLAFCYITVVYVIIPAFDAAHHIDDGGTPTPSPSVPVKTTTARPARHRFIPEEKVEECTDEICRNVQ